MPKLSSAIIGACGEHYVAAYLSRNDLLVALPRAGVKGSDLFVAAVESGRPLRIQVKTAIDPKGTLQGREFYSWFTNCPTIEHCTDTTWYAYVSLNAWPQTDDLPEVFFVPSGEVLKRLTVERDKNIEKKKENPTFFWAYSEELIPYKGAIGLTAMREAMYEKPVVI